MRIRYLIEKKNHSSKNPMGWYSWYFKYVVDYKTKESKIIKYNAYCMTEEIAQWSGIYRWYFSVYREEIRSHKETKTLIERDLGEYE